MPRTATGRRPAAHAVHAVAPSRVLVADPGAQSRQRESPVAGANVPGAQSEPSIIPGLPHARPRGHGRDAFAPRSGAQRPVGAGWHAHSAVVKFQPISFTPPGTGVT